MQTFEITALNCSRSQIALEYKTDTERQTTKNCNILKQKNLNIASKKASNAQYFYYKHLFTFKKDNYNGDMESAMVETTTATSRGTKKTLVTI